MKNTPQILQKDEQGFTLVELAIVMVIIGVLIGGILKGQELITNAKVTSTITTFQAISAAKNDFQNQYNALPGDLQGGANSRLSGCVAPNDACEITSTVTVGDGRLNTQVGAAMGTGGEGVKFYGQLLAANYISGMTGKINTNVQLGISVPISPLGGGFHAGDTAQGDPIGFGTLRAGQYITLVGSPELVGPGTGIVTAVQAGRIDIKLDDGAPNSGTFYGDSGVQAAAAPAAGCVTAVNATGVYANAVNSVCTVAYRM